MSRKEFIHCGPEVKCTKIQDRKEHFNLYNPSDTVLMVTYFHEHFARPGGVDWAALVSTPLPLPLHMGRMKQIKTN